MFTYKSWLRSKVVTLSGIPKYSGNFHRRVAGDERMGIRDDRRGLYGDYYRDSFPSPHDPVSCCPDSVGLKVLQVLSLDGPSRVSNFTSHGSLS